MRSYWSRWTPNSITSVLIRRQPNEERNTQGEGCLMAKAKTGVVHLQAKNTKDCSPATNTEKQASEDFSTDFRGNAVLPKPHSQMYSLQNCETINICCLSHPDCGTLLWQSLETKMTPIFTTASYTHTHTVNHTALLIMCYLYRSLRGNLQTVLL